MCKWCVYLIRLNSCPERQWRPSMPSQTTNAPTIRNEMASSMPNPYESWGTRRKRIPISRMQIPMLTSLLSRCSKESWVMSFWQVSQEEARRCRQQRHCRQAGHTVPGIEQSNTSQLSSTIFPFQKISCFSNQWCCSYSCAKYSTLKSAAISCVRYTCYLKTKQFGNKRTKKVSSSRWKNSYKNDFYGAPEEIQISKFSFNNSNNDQSQNSEAYR